MHLKPFFILYLIISSFCLSACSNIVEKDNSNSLNNVQNDMIQKLQKWVPEIGLAFTSSYLVDSIGKIFIAIGNGISFAYSSFYLTILETFGPNVAGMFVISTYVVVVIVVVGTAYTAYKVFIKDNTYIELGKFQIKVWRRK